MCTYGLLPTTLCPLAGSAPPACRHQLRKHCAETLGVPICGDDLYAAADARFIGKRSAGLFLQSVAVAVPHPLDEGRWVDARVPEAAKFGRQRHRGRLGFEHERRTG